MAYKKITEANLLREIGRRNVSTVLDVGCGERIYEKLFSKSKYTGIDVETSGHDSAKKNVDFYFDGIKIPLEDSTFDMILCTEVLEHCLDPDGLILEMHRVLKPGGAIYISVPSMWGEHEIPYDFRRYTSYGIKKALEDKGFAITHYEKESPGIEAFYKLGTSELRAHFGGTLRSSLKARIASATLKLCYKVLKRTAGMPRIYLSNHVVAEKPATR